jgi:hypothetical protein
LFGDRRIATAQIKFLGLTHYFRNLEALYYWTYLLNQNNLLYDG